MRKKLPFLSEMLIRNFAVRSKQNHWTHTTECINEEQMPGLDLAHARYECAFFVMFEDTFSLDVTR